MKVNDFRDFDKFYRVIYDGKMELIPFDAEGSEKVSNLVGKAEEERVRIEIRYKRMRMIYYFDYDRPATSGVDAEVTYTPE